MQKLPWEELPPVHEGGGCPPYRARPPASWAHGGPPPLILAPTHFVFLQKKSSTSLKLCSSSSCCHFRSPCSIHKTALGDCSSVCDSFNGPISFCSSALFIANFCCLGDRVLRLHVKFMWSKVVLMHDIASRHL